MGNQKKGSGVRSPAKVRGGCTCDAPTPQTQFEAQNTTQQIQDTIANKRPAFTFGELGHRVTAHLSLVWTASCRVAPTSIRAPTFLERRDSSSIDAARAVPVRRAADARFKRRSSHL